jgi:S-adenosylmethionine:diacylglycerol 3-amino-3-carboxypropyl transferase
MVKFNSQRKKYAISTGNFYLTHICSVFLKMAHKTCHFTGKTLADFMTMKKLRSYTQYLTHNGMLKLDYLFLKHPVVQGIGVIDTTN